MYLTVFEVRFLLESTCLRWVLNFRCSFLHHSIYLIFSSLHIDLLTLIRRVHWTYITPEENCVEVLHTRISRWIKQEAVDSWRTPLHSSTCLLMCKYCKVITVVYFLLWVFAFVGPDGPTNVYVHAPRVKFSFIERRLHLESKGK